MKADSICRINGVETTVIPVPEKISGQCGMCLRMTADMIVRFDEIMIGKNIEYTVYEQ